MLHSEPRPLFSLSCVGRLILQPHHRQGHVDLLVDWASPHNLGLAVVGNSRQGCGADRPHVVRGQRGWVIEPCEAKEATFGLAGSLMAIPKLLQTALYLNLGYPILMAQKMAEPHVITVFEEARRTCWGYREHSVRAPWGPQSRPPSVAHDAIPLTVKQGPIRPVARAASRVISGARAAVGRRGTQRVGFTTAPAAFHSYTLMSALSRSARRQHRQPPRSW